MHSVLVIRMSALGDVLFAMPAVRALLDSGQITSVTWLVEDRAAALLEHWTDLAEVIVFPRRRPAGWPAHVLTLARSHFDVVLDMQGNLKSRVQLGLVRAGRKVGYTSSVAREGAERSLTERVEPPPWARHRVAQNLALVAALGVRVDRPVPRPRLPVPDASRAHAAAHLADLPGDGPVIVLHPGTSAFGEFKRWPPHRFGELGTRLARRFDARILLTSGPGEEALIASVRSALTVHATVARSRSLHDLTALLQAADLVVAADSLPLHLANMLGTPVVGLYGPKDPARTGPFFDRSRVVCAGVACSPCTLRRCDDRICMEQLAVDAVDRAAEELLARGRA